MTAARILKKPLKKNIKSKHKNTATKKKTVKASAKTQLRVVKSKKTHKPSPPKKVAAKAKVKSQPSPQKPVAKVHPFSQFMQNKASYRPHAPMQHFSKHELYRKKAI